ncbi:MAG: DUF4919 domain-containing protein [Lentimicrobium sp.]|nr:DUF4919 domain-containing protein [Lentimicrobium sp.]
MKRALLCFIILITGFSGIQAQKSQFNPPDFKKIGKTINKTGKPLNYQNLLQRLNQNDTLLSLREYHLLYYGYALQPGFNPQVNHPLADSLMLILHKDLLNESDYQHIIGLASDLIFHSPFEISFLDPLILSYRMLGNEDMAARLEFRFGRIIETIFSSGDGLTQETAFHVVSVNHESDMLRALGFSYGGQRIKSGDGTDYLKVAKNDFGINGLFFRIPPARNL